MTRTALTVSLALVALAGTADARNGRPKAKALDPSSRSADSFSVIAGSGGQLGVEVTSMTDELRQFFGAPGGQGILVSRVSPGSVAEAAGVQVGDVIVSVAGQDVSEPWDVWNALSGKRKGDAVEVVVVRAGARKTLSAALQKDAIDTHGFSFGWSGSGQAMPKTFDFDGHMPRAMIFGDDDERVKSLEQRLEALEKRLRALEKR